jgi:hypothetical protein
MNRTLRSILLWLGAIVFTLAIAVFQRTTGPTYPVPYKFTLNGQEYKLKLLRTAETNTTEGEVYAQNGKFLEIPFIVADPAISGNIIYRRYKSYDEWIEVPMQRRGDTLFASFPEQPWAGKTEYNVSFSDGKTIVRPPEESIVLRFKGAVPDNILIPHILLMFLAMLFSARTGFAALAREKATFAYTIFTILFLVPGGLILGPIVQKYAFGAYWTGWPFGHDLTDNKTAIAFIAWLLALIMLWRNRENRGWALAASIVLLAMYLIPHSVLGSEIDHREQVPPATEQAEDSTLIPADTISMAPDSLIEENMGL